MIIRIILYVLDQFRDTCAAIPRARAPDALAAECKHQATVRFVRAVARAISSGFVLDGSSFREHLRRVLALWWWPWITLVVKMTRVCMDMYQEPRLPLLEAQTIVVEKVLVAL